MSNLLFEIQTEEIPAFYIEPACEAIGRFAESHLTALRIGHGPARTLATPRRLVLYVEDLAERQEALDKVVQGPSREAAFGPDGCPTKAAEGFAGKNGVGVADLQVRDTPRGKYVFAVKRSEGRPTMELLPDLLAQLAGSIPFPKSMHWRGKALTIARPVRGLLALYGKQVVPVRIGHMAAGRATPGHPFHAPGPIAIGAADISEYKSKLRRAKVVVDQVERIAMLRSAVEGILARRGASGVDGEILREVSFLLEWPGAVEGSIDGRYLDLPGDVLAAAMTEHQRYFPVRDEEGKFLPVFIAGVNRAGKNLAAVREGNERVLAARLADAKFFLAKDLERKLADRLPDLEGVVFQAKLGTYRRKSERIAALAAKIAGRMGLFGPTAAAAERAALLAKCDLVTEMVGEFPKLQGIIGGYYAQAGGETAEVAEAIREQYRPRGSADEPPATDAGRIVSIADKLDNLAGCFAAGLKPAGSQDPYALRRSAGGIVRILLASGLRLSLKGAILDAAAGLPSPFGENARSIAGDVADFARDRLYNMMIEAGYRHDAINAAMAVGFDDAVDFKERLDAVMSLSGRREFPSLCTLVERSSNILAKSRDAGLDGEVDESLLCEESERKLWIIYKEKAPAIRRAIEARLYSDASGEYLDSFARPIHEFFEKVFVNVPDDALRINRLRLLHKINRLYTDGAADLAKIEVQRAPDRTPPTTEK